MARWYLMSAAGPGLLPLDEAGFMTLMESRFAHLSIHPPDDASSVLDINLETSRGGPMRVTWLDGIIGVESSPIEAALIASVVRAAVPDDVPLQLMHESGGPVTRVLPGDTPEMVLQRGGTL